MIWFNLVVNFKFQTAKIIKNQSNQRTINILHALHLIRGNPLNPPDPRSLENPGKWYTDLTIAYDKL